jgi:serine/threonine protein kinase
MEKTHLDPSRAAAAEPTSEGPPRPPKGSPPTAAATGSTGSPHAPDAASDLRSLGEYRVLRKLGAGGFGAVYLGYDGKHDRQVALKVLNDDLAGDQRYVDRFYREARSGAQLNHPNIVRTLNVGLDRPTRKYYLVLEYVDGPSAQDLLAHSGQLPVGDAIHIALDVARALEHAHSRNIIHRDIKPDNILITRAGVAKLGDLGLAKRTDEASHLTQARQGFGTTAYMPYEQAMSAKHADGRSDIYALGATLYHLLTGVAPFPGDNHLEVVEKKNKGHYRPASGLNPAVTSALDQILARMLAREPRDRYQTASELIIDLERSRLAAPIPSFADAELARKDPWVQACLRTGEPTRLDPDSPVSGNPPPEVEWIVRYRNRAGRPFTTRITTDHLIERLDEGTLPANAEVRLPTDEEYKPLAAIAEFRDHIPEAPPEPEPKPKLKAKPQPPEPAGTKTFLLLLSAAAVLAAGLVGLVFWLWRIW